MSYWLTVLQGGKLERDKCEWSALLHNAPVHQEPHESHLKELHPSTATIAIFGMSSGEDMPYLTCNITYGTVPAVILERTLKQWLLIETDSTSNG